MKPRQRSRPTLKDVAAAAHVSISTVSYALNDKSTVQLAAETRARVRRIANELGYIPNGIARSLQSRSSRTVGIIVSKPLTIPRYAAIVQGAGAALTALGFRMAVLPDVHGSTFLEECRTGVLDGLVFVGHDDVSLPPALDSAAGDGSVPLVAIDCGPPPKDAPFSSVDFDYEFGAGSIIDHLARRGITTILHLRPEISSRAERQRQSALMQALGGVDHLTLQVVPSGFDEKALERNEASPPFHPHLQVQAERLASSLRAVSTPAERVAVLCSWGGDAESALSAVRSHAPGAMVAALASGTPRVELWSELVYSALPLEKAGAEAARLLAAAVRTDPDHEHVLLRPELTLPPAISD